MTQFNPAHPFVLAMKNWDVTKKTSECLHCHGTGLAPGDGRTECGFCDARPAPEPERRNLTLRQSEGRRFAGIGEVPRDAWYVLDVDTQEVLAWHRSHYRASKSLAYYETAVVD